MKSLFLGGGAVGLAASIAAGPAMAQHPNGIVIHMMPASFAACGQIDDQAIDCNSINEVGDITEPFQHAWLIAYGWPSLEANDGWPPGDGMGGASFGINYPASVDIQAWSLCTGGSQIRYTDPIFGQWPNSDSGVAVTWPGGNYSPPSPWAKIGFFLVGGGSEGRMTIAPHGDPSLDRVEFASSAPGVVTVTISPNAYSSADIGGTVPDDGRASCDEPVPTVRSSWGAIKALF